VGKMQTEVFVCHQHCDQADSHVSLMCTL